MRGGNYWDSGDWRVHRAASQQFSEKCAVDTRVVARKSGRLEEGEKVKASTAADSPAAGSFLDQVSGFPWWMAPGQQLRTS